MEEVIVKLKKKEIIYLAALLGSNEFMGIDYQYSSFTEVDIEKEWIGVQNSLEEKQLIETGFDGTIFIDEVLSKILHTCTETNLYLLQNITNDVEREIHYYITENLAVKMEDDISDQTILNFKLLYTAEDVIAEIIREYTIADLPYSYKQFNLAEETLEAVKQLVVNSDYDSAKEILGNLGLDNKILEEILLLLSQPKIYISLLMTKFAVENTGETEELIFIQSKNHLWRCRPIIEADKTLYEFTSKTYIDLMEILYSSLKDIHLTYISRHEEGVC